MKKLKFFLIAVLLCSTSISAFGQDDDEFVRQALEDHKQMIIYRARLARDVVGWHLGTEYSLRRINNIGVQAVTKHGVNFLGGYRFSKRWYVGGIAGISVATPFTMGRDDYELEEYNWAIDRRDKVYGVLMADARFYMSVRRASSYLFANLGGEYSIDFQKIAIFGIGFDVHTVKTQSINIGIGAGIGGAYSANSNWVDDLIGDENHGHEEFDGFVINFKIGYTF